MPEPIPQTSASPAWRRLRRKDLLVLLLLVAAMLHFRADGGASANAGPPVPPRVGGPAVPEPADSALRQLATEVPPPSYAEGSRERAVFEALNEARAKGNFGLLAQDERLDAAAAAHAAYMARNLEGALSHRQEADKPGFSGETPQQRIRAAGYDTAVSFEAISSGTTATACLELLNTVYHLGALTIGATEVGIGFDPLAGCVIEPQLPGRNARMQARPAGTVGVYPYPGQAGVPAGFMPATEIPNPAADLGDALLGPPILVDLNSAASAGLAADRIVLARFALTEAAGGAPAEVRILAGRNVTAEPASGLEPRVDRRLASAGQVFLLPLRPLKPSTAYAVEFRAAVNGIEVTRHWDFMTR